MEAQMTEKQRKFCDYYIDSGNATEAARKAGYSVKSAKVIGAENLTKPYLADYIRDKLDEMASERIADATEVLEYLTSVMRGESQSEIVVVEGSGDGYSSARKITKNPDEKERTRAAELLGKRHQLFTDKMSVEGTIPVVITHADDLED